MGASAVRGLRKTGLLAVIGAASACSFILDFDELQEGQGGAPGLGGAPGSGGQLSSGGSPPATSGEAGQASSQGGTEAAGGGTPAGAGMENATGGSSAGSPNEGGAGGQAPQCDPSCVSNDPCVSARCVHTENGAECLRTTETGLVYRSELPSLSAEKFDQLDLVAGEGEFYLSTLSLSGGVRDGAIHRVGLETNAKAKLAVQLADIFGAPARSAPVLMPNFPDRVIHAIFGVDTLQPGAEHADIGSVDFSREFEPTRHEILGEKYRPEALDNGRLQRPTAIYLRNTALYVAWLDGTSEVQFAQDEALSRDAIPSFYWPDYPISAVKLVTGRAQFELDIVYTVPGLGVYFGEPRQDPRLLKECETRPGELEGLALAPTAYDGRWLLSWSKRGANYVSTEAHFVGCSPLCDFIQPTCAEGGRGEHDIALASVTIRENPPLSDVVRVLPIAASVSKNTPASLRAQATRLDLSAKDNPEEAPLGGEITLAEDAPYRDDRGPDQLAVAIAGREVLVAWAEPAASGSSENLRLKRLTLCSPPPDSP